MESFIQKVRCLITKVFLNLVQTLEGTSYIHFLKMNALEITSGHIPTIISFVRQLDLKIGKISIFGKYLSTEEIIATNGLKTTRTVRKDETTRLMLKCILE